MMASLTDLTVRLQKLRASRLANDIIKRQKHGTGRVQTKYIRQIKEMPLSIANIVDQSINLLLLLLLRAFI